MLCYLQTNMDLNNSSLTISNKCEKSNFICITIQKLTDFLWKPILRCIYVLRNVKMHPGWASVRSIWHSSLRSLAPVS